MFDLRIDPTKRSDTMRHAEIEFLSVEFKPDDPPHNTAHVKLQLAANNRMLTYPITGTRLVAFDQTLLFPSSYRIAFDLADEDHIAVRVTALDFDNPPPGATDAGGEDPSGQNQGVPDNFNAGDDGRFTNPFFPQPDDWGDYNRNEAEDSISPRPARPVHLPVRPMILEGVYPGDADFDQVITAESTLYGGDAYDERFEMAYRVMIHEPVTPPFAVSAQTGARA
jgi:hypothetical protein